MRVNVTYTNAPAWPLTQPFPEKNGFLLRLVKGSWCDMFFGNWFKEPWPWLVITKEVSVPIPYVAWRFGSVAGYIGAKVYGVDSPEYKHWLPEKHVYEGSQAFCLSFRPFARSRINGD
jgi:hypothetical protein